MSVFQSVKGDRELPAEVTLAFYRIAQEAFNDVTAEATRVNISLLEQPDRVELGPPR